MTDAIRFVSSVEDAFEMKRWLGERRTILGLDTETGGLNPYLCDLRLVQFGDGAGGWAVPFDDWKGLLREVFRSYTGEWTLHNALFDAHFLRVHLGIELDWPRVHDTQLASHVVNPPDRHGLKYQAVKRVHAGAAGGEIALKEAMRKGRWTWETVPLDLPEYWAYGVMDTIIDVLLKEKLDAEIDARGLREVYELERAVEAIIYQMERKGCLIDLQYCSEQQVRLDEYQQSVRAWAEREYGVKNLTSNAEVAKRMIQDGVQFPALTATGAPSMTEPVLSALNHPLGNAVISVRQSTKIASSYFANFKKYATNSQLHPRIRQVAARTGRMSITEPAMQTLPKGPLVRDAFVAREGFSLVSIDYDQIELRIFASFAQELPLMEAIRAADNGEGPDLHTWVAQAVYGDDSITKSDMRRNLAKNTQFCLIFGGGAGKIAETAGVTFETAEAFLAKYLELFPGIRRFQKQVEQVVKKRERETGTGYVIAPSGRYHPLLDDEGAYKCCNYLVQGSAADVLKRQMVSLSNAGFAQYMLLPVHDEVVFELPEEEAREMVPDLREAMEDHFSFSVPLRVSPSDPHPRWGACK